MSAGQGKSKFWTGVAGAASAATAALLFGCHLSHGFPFVPSWMAVLLLAGVACMFVSLHNKHVAIFATALVLGLVASISVAMMQQSHGLVGWSLYTVFLCIFHCGEFLWSSWFHSSSSSSTDFLLNHSREYHMAMAAAVVEYHLERFLFPSLKAFQLPILVGLCIVAAGQAVRTLAMWTAGANFTHLVAERKVASHQLVSSGIYSLLRHPAYFGWFWWSVGTQILLANPICTVLFWLASSRFFAGRIPSEEVYLSQFFPSSYAAYARRTVIGIPGVTGFIPYRGGAAGAGEGQAAAPLSGHQHQQEGEGEEEGAFDAGRF